MLGMERSQPVLPEAARGGVLGTTVLWHEEEMVFGYLLDVVAALPAANHFIYGNGSELTV